MVKSYCIFIPEWVVAGLPREYMPLKKMHDNMSEALTCRDRSEVEVVGSHLLHAHHKSDPGNTLTFDCDIHGKSGYLCFWFLQSGAV